MINNATTLDDLISLNHEIAAMVRAGVPLELGLRGFMGGTRSRLARLSDRLANRLANGSSLPDALAEEGPAVSPIYTAVITAGLASGRLPEALESLAVSGEMIQETRRRIFLAALYPIICLGLAYAMFCGFLNGIAPRVLNALETFPRSWPIDLLTGLYANRGYVTMVIPSAVIALSIVMILLRNGAGRGVWQYLTSFRWVIGQSLNSAQFAELFGLQVEQGLPLAQSFVLAADSTDDARWHRQARLVAEKLTSGSTFVESLEFAKSLPPLARWMLANGERQGTLATTVRQLAEMYRRRALRRAAMIKIWLPVAMTIVFTGTIGLAYGLAFFIPLRAFLIGLSNE